MEKFVKTAGKESKREVQESYPLTNTQEGIFIECTANMGSTIYNIPYLLKLDNKVNLDRLAEAIDSTVEAHPYLKTRLFMDDNGNVLQKRNDGLSYKTPILNGMNRDTLVRPYMLFNEQLFRFEIYRTCDGNYLFLDLHHIVADGTSLAIIINDINRAYSGEKLEPEGYTSYDLALDNRDAWQVISIKMQRIIISQYLNMQVEASASIRTKTVRLQQQNFTTERPDPFLCRM